MSKSESILDSSAASRLFSAFSSFKRFSVSCHTHLTGDQVQLILLRPLLDIVNRPPVERRQGGKWATHSDLDIGRKSGEVEEVVIAVNW